MSEMRKTGEIIRNRRRELGLSQRQLAKLVGVQPTTVSRWETGQGYPDQGIVGKLALELGITTDELFCMDDFLKKEKKKGYTWIDWMLFWLQVILIMAVIFILMVDGYFSLGKVEVGYISIYHNRVLDFIILSLLIVLDVIFIFFRRIRNKMIRRFYRLKFYHKFPAGYDFQIRNGYITFIIILLLLSTLLMLVIVTS